MPIASITNVYFKSVIVPADGTTAATIRNGDFGTSPFFEQLSDKPQLACVGLCGESGVKHNKGLRIYQ
jgi:hypothetical protein